MPEAELWDVFNMGCGFVAVVPEAAADEAAALLAGHHPGTRRIGTVTDEAGADASAAGGASVGLVRIGRRELPVALVRVARRRRATAGSACLACQSLRASSMCSPTRSERSSMSASSRAAAAATSS